MAVDFWEIAGYPQESHDAQAFKAQRKLLCKWDERHTLRAALLGWPRAWYPYTLDDRIRAEGVTVEPIGLQSQSSPITPDVASYEWAIMTVDYSSPSMGQPQPYPKDKDASKHNDITKAISETLEPNVEALKMDYRLFEWTDGTALLEDEAPVRMVYRMAYSLTRHYQDNLPTEAVTKVGCINAASVTPILYDGVTFDAQTLLYVPPQLDFSVNDEGETTIDVTYRFAYKEEGWRKFWRADTKAYAQIRKTGAGATYDQPATADFTVFFP